MKSNVSKFATLIARLTQLAVANPRGFRQVLGVALAESEGVMDNSVDVLPIPPVALEDLATEPLRGSIAVYPPTESSVNVLEVCSLVVLLQKVKARRVFEFGTFRGISTTQLAMNVPEGAEVFTLDLPADDPRTQFSVTEEYETKLVKLRVKGDLMPPDLRQRVTFLAQDSALFDPSPYAGSMDFVFVDGAHTAEYVKNDSEKAWAMLRPGGIVAWHDCRPQSPAVVKFLRNCPYDPRRILGTTIAFAVKPGPTAQAASKTT